jgi:hypothetical protein
MRHPPLYRKKFQVKIETPTRFTIPALHNFKFRTFIDLHERSRLAFVHYRSLSFIIVRYRSRSFTIVHDRSRSFNIVRDRSLSFAIVQDHSLSYFFNFCYLFYLIKNIYKIYIKIRISLSKVLVWHFNYLIILKSCSAPSKRYHSIYNLTKAKLGIKQYAISCICWFHHRLIALLSFFSVLHRHS